MSIFTWIIILQVIMLLLIGIIGYHMTSLIMWKDDFDKKMSRKVKGISKKDQQNIDKVKDALEKDLEATLGSIDFNKNVKELEGLPNFSALLQQNPNAVSSGISSFGMMDLISSLLKSGLLQGGGDASMLSMLTTENAKNAAIAGVVYKIVKGIATKKQNNAVTTTENISTKAQDNEKKYVKSNW